MKSLLPSLRIILPILGIVVIAVAVFVLIPKPIVFPKDLPAAQRAANRRIAFSGAANFRDLGGYQTADGHTVKWGLLYRSDALNALTANDLQYLARLSLNRIIDFRADFEKAASPDRLPPGNSIPVVELPILDANSQLGTELRQKIMDGQVDGIDPDQLLTDANIAFASDFTPQYKQFIQEVLAADGRPILWHCTAGKDRAGFAAAILLRILGVPQPTVMNDYLLSGPYTVKAHTKDVLMLQLTKGQKSADVVRGLFNTKPEYLTAAFTTIDQKYGSFDQYVKTGLGLTGQDVQKLRSLLLEP